MMEKLGLNGKHWIDYEEWKAFRKFYGYKVMENKYYTPSIEEFHVGFEYEQIEFIYTDKGWYTSKEEKWISKIYDPTNYLENYYLAERVKRNLFKNSIRVKYLDKADIESLGFVCNCTDQYFKDDYIILIDDDYFLQVLKEDSEEEIYLFQGTIKNKAELKVLLKQLGIV